MLKSGIQISDGEAQFIKEKLKELEEDTGAKQYQMLIDCVRVGLKLM